MWVTVTALAFALPNVLTSSLNFIHEDEVGSKNIAAEINLLWDKVDSLNRNNQQKEAINLLLNSIAKEHADSIKHTVLSQILDFYLTKEVNESRQKMAQNPKNASAYLRLALALNLLGQRFHAQQILLNGIKNNPKVSSLWLKIGMLELESGRDLEALDVFKEAIRLNHKNGEAYFQAANIFLKKFNKLDSEEILEAKKYAFKAAFIEPKNASYLDTLASFHFLSGNMEEARLLINKAIELAPEERSFKEKLDRFND